MNNVKRQELIDHAETLMAQYCNGCFLHKHLKQEHGRKAAHRFCITQCTVGEKLKKFGERLS